MTGRTATLERNTAETRVSVSLTLDGTGQCTVSTGLPFLDHMVHAFARHGRLDLELGCKGDLEVDDHHSVEDCALALGAAVDRALGDRAGIARFGHAYAPLDEALARCVVDLSGRAHAAIDLGLRRQSIGNVSCENLGHFLSSFATASRCTLHVDVLKGDNDHHRAEAAFKALAVAFRQAIALTGAPGIPSTKGVI